MKRTVRMTTWDTGDYYDCCIGDRYDGQERRRVKYGRGGRRKRARRAALVQRMPGLIFSAIFHGTSILTTTLFHGLVTGGLITDKEARKVFPEVSSD